METILIGFDREEVLSILFAIQEFHRNPRNAFDFPATTKHLGDIKKRIESTFDNPWED